MRVPAGRFVDRQQVLIFKNDQIHRRRDSPGSLRPRVCRRQIFHFFFWFRVPPRGIIADMTKPVTGRSPMSRRRFLAVTGAAGAAFAVPTIIPASALGREGRPPPSGRITVGIVGWGMIAPDNTRGLMALDDCQVVATCNIDKNHLKKSLDTINGHYKNQDCKTYHDYRKMISRKDIDAVMIAVPDHWHEIIAVFAARHKKDI
jgi:hypothetical protein